MIILWACLVAAGGRTPCCPAAGCRGWAGRRWRHTWLVWLALAVQVVVISVLPDGRGLSEAAHLATYALARRSSP